MKSMSPLSICVKSFHFWQYMEELAGENPTSMLDGHERYVFNDHR